MLSSIQSVNAEENENRGQLSPADYKFVCEAAHGGQMEVVLGQLAMQKAANPAVRDFGQRMVTDHQKANDELTKLVAQKGASLPDSSKKEEVMKARFNKLSGADFDKAYMKDMVADHKKDVKEFQKEGEKAQDADLKSWVTKTLPTLQTHLDLSEKVEAQVAPLK